MNKNICRPIILYNNFVPPTTQKQTWEYEALGYYDGISIGENIIQDGFELKHIWTDLAEHVKNLKGKHIAQVMYVFRNERNKNSITDSEFWKEQNGKGLFPYIFITMLRLKQPIKDAEKVREILEEKAQKQETKLITYTSLDNNDLVVVIKSRKYSQGTEIIDQFHQRMKSKKSNNLSPFYDSFSVAGINKKCLNSDEYLFDDKDDIIDRICLRIIEKEPGTIQYLKEELYDCMDGAIVSNYPVLGCEDEVFIIENISFGQFLKLHQDLKGILSSSNIDVYHKAVMGITSLVLQNRMGCGKNLFDEVKNDKRIKIKGICKELREKYIEFFENSIDDFVINEKIYYKAILQIINSLQKYENMEYIDYTYIALYEPMLMLTDLLDEAKSNKNEKLISSISSFFNAINLLTQNSVRLERQFIQSVELNARIFEAPVLLSLFYKVYFGLLRDILNECVEANHKYEFMICPGMIEYLNVQKLLPNISKTKCLLLVEIPENQMYDVKSLLIIMAHEAAHFVGRDIRQREIRYTYMLEAIVRSVETFLVFDSDMHQYCSEEIVEEFREGYLITLKDALENYCAKIEHLSKGERRRADRYHTECMREDLLICAQSVLIGDTDLLNSVGGRAFYRLCDEYRQEDIEPQKKLNIHIKFESEFENSKIEFINKMIISAETLSDEPCINNIIDSNIHFFKESFADLLSVLLLELSIGEYLETIIEIAKDQLSDENLGQYSTLMWRIVLVIKAMCRKEFCDEFLWDIKDLKKLEEKEVDSKKTVFLKSILDIINYLKEQKTLFKVYDEYIVERQTYYNKDRMYNYKIVDIFVEYLVNCRIKFQENFRKGMYSKDKKIEKLRRIYRSLYNMEDIEDYIYCIKEVIEEYKNNFIEE